MKIWMKMSLMMTSLQRKKIGIQKNPQIKQGRLARRKNKLIRRKYEKII